MRLGADRVLRAMARLRRQPAAVMASAALAVIATARPNLLPPELATLATLLNVNAIHDLLKAAADESSPDDEELAARMEQLMPVAQLDELATGQKDMLRALTRQDSWRQQMLRLQEADAAAGAQLLTGLAEIGVDLVEIRETLAGVATQSQLADLTRLIETVVLPRLSEPIRAKYLMSGDFRGSTVIIESQVTLPWSPLPPFTPAPPPPPGPLPDPGRLPPGSRMPYGRNPMFTGREDELRELAALLPDTKYEATPVALRDTSEARSSLVSRISNLVSSGIGGIGKTQLAVEFAHRYGRFFHGVHWVSMADPAAVETEIILCGAGMRLRPDFDALPPAAQLRETLAAWAGPDVRLLIFDNCEEPALLAEWRPKSGGARVLVTSRNALWPVEYGAAVLSVAPLPRAQSVALLEEYLDPAVPSNLPASPSSSLSTLAAELGDMPLALALAGHYLSVYRRESVESYLAQLGRVDDLLPVGRGAYSPTDHNLSVWRTFAVSYDRLRPDDAVDAAALALLTRAACFAPGEPLPEGLLLAAMDRRGEATGNESPPGDEIPAPVASPHLVDDGLMRLRELGLLERIDDEVYRLHRLIARFVMEEISRKGAKGTKGEEDEEDVMAAARAAVEGAVIALAYEQNTAGDPRALREWEIHLRHVTDAAFDR